MKMLYHLQVIGACVLLTGCGGGFSSSNSAPPTVPPPSSEGTEGTPASNDVMRAGDKVTLRLSGVPDEGYVIEVQIPASGDVTVPLLNHPFRFIGRDASDVAAEIRESYKAEKIYSNPNVTIIPEERFVSVGGDVRAPNRVPYTPDLTVLGAINACSGFTEYANRRAVRVLRGDQTIQVDCVAAQRSASSDLHLKPGDQIHVPRTIF